MSCHSGELRGWRGNGDPGAEAAVLVLELGDSALEVAELRFPPIPAVLGGDAVAVGAGFLALLRGDFGARAFARRLGGGLRAMSGTVRRGDWGELTEGRSWARDEGDGEGESNWEVEDMASDEGSMKDVGGAI